MTVYVVQTNYLFGNQYVLATNYFGVYSSLTNARKAIIAFLNNEKGISWRDNHDYSYTITTEEKNYWIEILTDELDADLT